MEAVCRLIVRGGLVVPAAAMALGALWPTLGGNLLAWLPELAMVLVVSNVLLAELGRPGAREFGAVVLLVALNLLVTPMALAGLRTALGLPEALGWVALAAGAPVAASAVVAASALGAPVRPVVTAYLGTVLLLPVSLPAVAAVALPEVAVDTGKLAERSALVILLPAALAFLLRHVLGRRREHVRMPVRAAGVVGLMLVALAQGAAMPAVIHVLDPASIHRLAAATLAGLALAGIAAALVGARLGAAAGTTFGLGGACRNVSLTWAALGPWLPPSGMLVLSVALIVTFSLPALAPLLDRLSRARTSRGAGAAGWQRRGARPRAPSPPRPRCAAVPLL